MSMTRLPVLDIAELRANRDSRSSHDICKTLRDICHYQGFCYVTGHGLTAPRQQISQAAKDFFDLPLADRKALVIANTPHFRGYTVLGDEQTKGRSDWRDQIDFADEALAPVLSPTDPKWLNLRGPNQWPVSFDMQPAVRGYLEGMHELGVTMLSALAEGLGIGRDYFAPYFTPRGDARLKLIRYKVPKDGTGKTGQGVGWHNDTGFLTFIMQDSIGGLQVEINGETIDATPMQGAFVMNLGEMLQVATGGYLRATPHRVISPPPGTERHSIAYFFNPKLESEFAPIALPEGLDRHARGAQNIDPDDPVFNVVGQNILKTRLRAHPDVAAKFYPSL